MISIKNVGMRYPKEKRYRDYLLRPFRSAGYRTALEGITMEIAAGDRVALLGTNGAGKTTLLKLIGGLLYPSDGQIVVNGFDTVRQNRAGRKCVGYVLNEERSFFWRLTGRQNLEFFGALDNLFGRSLSDKIDSLLDLVGMREHADVPFSNYSSGMKQRLTIARGLMSDPQILILDEPTRTLDPISSQEIKHLLLKKLNSDQQHTLLIATHRLDEAEALCNRICVMKKGQMLLCAPTETVIATYGSLEACFVALIGEPQSLVQA